MPHINQQWEELKPIAAEMIKDAALLAISEYRHAYPKDMGVSSPHLPEAIAVRVMGKLDDLFYQATKMLREQEAPKKGRGGEAR